MKVLFIFLFLAIAIGAQAQKNSLMVGYGLNAGDEKIFRERDHYIVNKNLVANLCYTREVHEYFSLQANLAYADYDVINAGLEYSPDFIERPFTRISVSVGAQFRLLRSGNFTFLSGFNGGYHWGSDETVRSDYYTSSYWDYAINPLSITYAIKGFTVAVDSYIGSNMYSNVFVGLGYSF